MNPTAGATYDTIGRAYSRHRRTDPRIARAIGTALGPAKTVLNVGAGTGSYEPTDRAVVAVDVSAVMLAQRAPGSPSAVMGSAHSLPFRDGSFDAAMAIFTLHHWDNPSAGLAEMRRVARRQVLLTFDPEVDGGFWLLDYLPAAADVLSKAIPLAETVALLGATRIVEVLVPHDCADGFWWAYWRRPERYLDPEVRSCISMFAQLATDQLEPGLTQLAEDLASGAWSRKYGRLLKLDAVDGGYRLLIRG